MLEPSAAAASTRLIIKQRKGGTGASPVPMARGSWGSYEVPGDSGGGVWGVLGVNIWFLGVQGVLWGFWEFYGVPAGSGSSIGFLGVLGVLWGFWGSGTSIGFLGVLGLKVLPLHQKHLSLTETIHV